MRITAVFVIILASVSFWMITHNDSGSIRKELYDFAVADTASITKIYIANTGGKELTLQKEKAGRWKVNGKFTARNDAIKNLLVCMKEMQVKNPVAKSAIENVSKQLATASQKVEIYSGEKLIRSYYVGSDTQDGLGTFMLLTDPKTGENSSMPFVMFIPGFNGFLSIRYFMEEDLWRDRTIFAFFPDKISSISVEYPRIPDSSFAIALSDKNEISLANSKGENIHDFDTLKAKRYITYYTNIQYEVLKNDMQKSYVDSVLAKGPVHIIRLRDREGKVHTVKTFSRPADDSNQTDDVTGKPITEDLQRMFALINNDKDIALIQYYSFGKLFQSISFFQKTPSSGQAIHVKK